MSVEVNTLWVTFLPATLARPPVSRWQPAPLVGRLVYTGFAPTVVIA